MVTKVGILCHSKKQFAPANVTLFAGADPYTGMPALRIRPTSRLLHPCYFFRISIVSEAIISSSSVGITTTFT